MRVVERSQVAVVPDEEPREPLAEQARGIDRNQDRQSGEKYSETGRGPAAPSMIRTRQASSMLPPVHAEHPVHYSLSRYTQCRHRDGIGSA